ncbi:NAD-dependent epimerase/dehydratase family protein [Streptomyces sp. A3M-1-3]|uniref:NAD-dependent epimerase/dehydratase family protein n=1 Tax=Streptomyces sp. A3M-1-3 TaxID=2962044 RepID=UPI0020B83672|nr:NAD-dependent epimerase/dehydratase family protein [Streptomyces sp. A3M-1-3]MCP3818457.1 NAD-dependent epimerase/dehydratase family protein [Streptomyces sp. A3M-1-3]
MSKQVDVVVAGGGGFIGGHLVADLLSQGLTVRSIDIKPQHEWYQVHGAAENVVADLSLLENARAGVRNAGQVYMLAADMGGMGFIENNKAACMMTALTSTHMLKAAHEAGVDRYFYSSSACVYAAGKQTDPNVTALKEEDAYPAQPEDGYGWEKLFSERMCRHFEEDFGFTSRVARYHNVYGPEGTWTGGREKAPAAVCRKIAEAVVSGEHKIDIWGDGRQTRSFMYVDDCLHGSQMIAKGDSSIPVNLGSSELVTINQLVDIVEEIAGIRCERTYQLDAPQGVRGRNSDNTLIQEIYGWQPSIALADGLEKTYPWVYDQVKRARR